MTLTDADLDALEADAFTICTVAKPGDDLTAPIFGGALGRLVESVAQLVDEVRRMREAATDAEGARQLAVGTSEGTERALTAARLDAANARSVAVEALALLDARLNTRTLEGYVFKDEAEAQAATLRARLDASDFAARATAAIDKYGEAERDLGYDARDAVPDDGNAPFPVDADKQQARDAARAEVLAVIGVGRG